MDIAVNILPGFTKISETCGATRDCLITSHETLRLAPHGGIGVDPSVDPSHWYVSWCAYKQRYLGLTYRAGRWVPETERKCNTLDSVGSVTKFFVPSSQTGWTAHQ
jgi:hypothetical protein